MSASPKRTGIVCLSCDQPVGVPENKMVSSSIFWCPACDHRWITRDPPPKTLRRFFPAFRFLARALVRVRVCKALAPRTVAAWASFLNFAGASPSMPDQIAAGSRSTLPDEGTVTPQVRRSHTVARQRA